jgi:hypothetical protein
MANPNIVNVTSILGKTVVGAITTSPAAVVSNTAGSNTILKINTAMFSNAAATAATVTAYITSGAASADLVYQVSVPIGATLIAISKDNPVYLEEGQVFTILASANSILEYVISYEQIS